MKGTNVEHNKTDVLLNETCLFTTWLFSFSTVFNRFGWILNYIMLFNGRAIKIWVCLLLEWLEATVPATVIYLKFSVFLEY